MSKVATAKTTRSVLVDTSFLITLFNDERPNHETAKKYYRYFIRNEIEMVLSVIAISEFHQIQPITDIIATGNFRVLPFNYEDALSTAEVSFRLGGMDRRGDSAAKYKDDLKLIGQADRQKIDYIITDDSSTLFRYCERLNNASMLETVPIALKDGFDGTLFNGGQSSLIDEGEV